MNKNQAGKGSKPRPVNLLEYEKNYDAINWSHKKKDKKNGKSKTND